MLLRRTNGRFVSFRLRNDLHCVGWGVQLYSLTHRRIVQNGAKLRFLLQRCTILHNYQSRVKNLKLQL